MFRCSQQKLGLGTLSGYKYITLNFILREHFKVRKVEFVHRRQDNILVKCLSFEY